MTRKRRPVIVMLLLATIMCIVTSLPASMNLPLVDPGLFVISGVKTCGNSSGYCLLGSDCTTDDDFLPDPSGSCEGLKRAFTPSAPFVCCKFNKRFPHTEIPILNFNLKNDTSTETNKLARNRRENIDSLKMDSDQLAKLSQIESVVKKIVEQLINETANHIKSDESIIVNEENTTISEIRKDIPMAESIAKTEMPVMFNDSTEINETTVNPSVKEVETIDDGNSLRTEIPPENKEETETNQSDTSELVPEESETNQSDTSELVPEESFIDDEFKAGKQICQKTCKSEIIFMVDKKPLCYGTLLDDIWVLTSATCASRLNKANIRKVAVSRKDLQVGPTLNISNILVHENFKSPASKISPEYNDLSLVSLSLPLQGPECIPCLNHKSTITNEVCKNFQTNNFKNTVKSGENCEGKVQLRKLSNSYLLLPCNRWRMQYNQEGRLGSGLWCDGKLAGIQTGVGVGSLIYTPVNEYAEWISDNKRIEKRR